MKKILLLAALAASLATPVAASTPHYATIEIVATCDGIEITGTLDQNADREFGWQVWQDGLQLKHGLIDNIGEDGRFAFALEPLPMGDYVLRFDDEPVDKSYQEQPFETPECTQPSVTPSPSHPTRTLPPTETAPVAPATDRSGGNLVVFLVVVGLLYLLFKPRSRRR